MKVVILAGGKGTRLFEKTEHVPKPLILLSDGRPIIGHIMTLYSRFGFREFVICLGYKGEMIRHYFETIDVGDWKIDFVDTGIETGTAGRVRKIKNYVGENFFLTYGDGLCNVDICDLLDFHKSHGKILTVTAVRPLVRFGMLDLDGNKVNSFSKYSVPKSGWIDGGFFVCNAELFEHLENISDKQMLEGKIMERIAKISEFMAFKHEGYWRCIDTYRDLLIVNKDLKNKEF